VLGVNKPPQRVRVIKPAHSVVGLTNLHSTACLGIKIPAKSAEDTGDGVGALLHGAYSLPKLFATAAATTVRRFAFRRFAVAAPHWFALQHNRAFGFVDVGQFGEPGGDGAAAASDGAVAASDGAAAASDGSTAASDGAAAASDIRVAFSGKTRAATKKGDFICFECVDFSSSGKDL
jgi:hypothetical protein